MNLNRFAALGLFVPLVLAGCGDNLPRTHTASGRVALADGDTQKLAGHHVEAALESDPTVRASGVISPDGAFTLETLHAGTVLKGAREGTYRVRILPAAEDENGKKLKKPPIAAKYLNFETSGLSFSVPATDEVKLVISPK